MYRRGPRAVNGDHMGTAEMRNTSYVSHCQVLVPKRDPRIRDDRCPVGICTCTILHTAENCVTGVAVQFCIPVTYSLEWSP